MYWVFLASGVLLGISTALLYKRQINRLQTEQPRAPMVDHIFADLGFEQGFDLRDELLQELSNRLEAAPVGVQMPLASFVPQVDQYQQRVVEATAQTMRVVAPAGSGKTQTMLNRVLLRIQQGLNPERLLLLTFDN